MSKVVSAVVSVGLIVAGVIFAQPQLIVAGVMNLGNTLLTPKVKQQARQASVVGLTLGETAREAIIGQALTGGSLVDAFNYGGKYGTDWEVQIIALADHECDALVGFYVNDNYRAFTGDGAVAGYNGQLAVYFRSGTENQTLPSIVTTHGRDWSPSDNGAGVAYVVVAYKADEADAKNPVWPAGRPRFSWLVRGAKVYQARKDSTVPGGSGSHRRDNPATWEWTDNPIDCRYAWVRGFYACNRVNQPDQLLVGRGLSAAEAPPQNVFAPANICDEMVAVSGGTEKRYTVGGVIEADEPHIETEELFASACGGVIIQPEGSVEIEPGQAKSPSFFFTDDDLIVGSKVTFKRFRSKADNEWINTVVPRYVEPSQKWADHAAPVRRDVADILADGGTREETLSLPFVNRGTQAGRVGEMRRRLGRLQRTATVTLGQEFCEVEEGDWGVWTSQRYLDGQSVAFRVEAFGLDRGWQNTLQLREINASVFSEGAFIPDQAVADQPGAPPAIGAPAPGSWTLTAEQLSVSGTAIPAIVITGAVEDPYADAVRFEYWMDDGVTTPAAVTNWSGSSVTGPGVKRREITSVAPGATYYAAVSYVIDGRPGDRLILGPVEAGELIADGNTLRIEWSADGSTNWHTDYVDGDNYMRQSSDGGQTWSEAIPLATTPGATGNKIQWVWKRSATQPATPTGNGIPAGTTALPPADDGNPLWGSVAEQKSDGTTIGLWSEFFRTSGQLNYTWTAYADSADGVTNFTTGNPGSRRYLGIATNRTTPTEGSTPADYTWSLIRGDSALTVVLSNPTHTVPTDKDGNNGDFTAANGVIQVYYGGVDVTASCTFTESGEDLITGQVNNSTNQLFTGPKGAYRVTALGGDSGTYTIAISYNPGSGAIATSHDFTVSKSRAGADGSPAKIAYVTTNHATVSYDSLGAVKPLNIEVTATRQGTAQPIDLIVYAANASSIMNGGSGGQAMVLSSNNGAFSGFGTVTVSGDKVVWAFTAAQFAQLLVNNSTTGMVVLARFTDGGKTYEDRIDIKKVQDGAKGADGSGVELKSTGQAFRYVDGVIQPMTLTFDAIKTAAGTLLWEVTDAQTGGVATQNTHYTVVDADTVTISHGQFALIGSNQVRVRAYINGGPEASIIVMRKDELSPVSQSIISYNTADATAADGTILNISADGVITVKEKQNYLVPLWNGIQSRYSNYRAQAVARSVSVTSFDAAYNALNNYIASYSSMLNTTKATYATADLRTYITNYHSAEAALVANMNDKASQTAIYSQITGQKPPIDAGSPISLTANSPIVQSGNTLSNTAFSWTDFSGNQWFRGAMFADCRVGGSGLFTFGIGDAGHSLRARWYGQGNGSQYAIYIDGAYSTSGNIAALPVQTAGDHLSIAYDGSAYLFFRNGVLYHRHVAAANRVSRVMGSVNNGTITDLQAGALPNLGGYISTVDGRVNDARFNATAQIMGQLNAYSGTLPTYTGTDGAWTVNIPAHNRMVGTTEGNRTTLSYPGGSTTYGNSQPWWAYIDDPDVNGGGSIQFTTDKTNLTYPGRLEVSSGVTPAAGATGGTIGTGGGGGGGCVDLESFMPDGRFARDYVAGDALRVIDEETWDRPRQTTVDHSRIVPDQPCIRLLSKSGIWVVCSLSTPLTLKGGRVVYGHGALGKKMAIEDEDGFRWEKIVAVEDWGRRAVMLISAENQTYAAGGMPGRFIYTHNMYEQKF